MVQYVRLRRFWVDIVVSLALDLVRLAQLCTCHTMGRESQKSSGMRVCRPS